VLKTWGNYLRKSFIDFQFYVCTLASDDAWDKRIIVGTSTKATLEEHLAFR